uniref:Uncharacterized protein n=1 Tax=Populus trichocarpa TaxID=3694 RepID=A0A3N7EHF2_POPTR
MVLNQAAAAFDEGVNPQRKYQVMPAKGPSLCIFSLFFSFLGKGPFLSDCLIYFCHN